MVVNILVFGVVFNVFLENKFHDFVIHWFVFCRVARVEQTETPQMMNERCAKSMLIPFYISYQVSVDLTIKDFCRSIKVFF